MATMATKRPRQQSSSAIITDLNKYDVLCGRGSGPNERVGNIHFRDLVATRKSEYLSIKPRDHLNKNRIAREIVEDVRGRGGRFLKRVSEVDAGGGEEGRRPSGYALADEGTVLEKAKQALRQNRTPQASGGGGGGRGRVGQKRSMKGDQPMQRGGMAQHNLHQGGGMASSQHMPPPQPPNSNSDAYEAFVSNFATTNAQQPNNRISAEEAALIRSIQMKEQQNYQGAAQHGLSMAEEAYVRSMQMQSYMQHQQARQAAAAAQGGAGGRGTPDEVLSYGNALAMLQHYQGQNQRHHPQHHHHAAHHHHHQQQIAAHLLSEDNTASDARLDALISTAAAGGDISEAYARLYPEDEQSASSSGIAAPTPLPAAASSSSMQTDTRSPSSDNRSILSGVSISASQIKALETIFDCASQQGGAGLHGARAYRRYSDEARRRAAGNAANEGTRRGSSGKSNDSFDGLEDMSLPSMSIGDISDFTSIQGQSLMGQSLPGLSLSLASRSRHSIGGGDMAIAEGTERDSSMDGSNNNNNNMNTAGGGDRSVKSYDSEEDRLKARIRELEYAIALERRPDTTSAASSFLGGSDREYNANRHVSFMGNGENGGNNNLLHHAAGEEISSGGDKFSTASQKKKRQSLSSYYRELKAANAPPSAMDTD